MQLKKRRGDGWVAGAAGKWERCEEDESKNFRWKKGWKKKKKRLRVYQTTEIWKVTFYNLDMTYFHLLQATLLVLDQTELFQSMSR